MTALRERAVQLVQNETADKWRNGDCGDSTFADLIESTLRALVEELEHEVTRRTIQEVESDWDRGYNMAVQDIAQVICEKGGIK